MPYEKLIEHKKKLSNTTFLPEVKIDLTGRVQKDSKFAQIPDTKSEEEKFRSSTKSVFMTAKCKLKLQLVSNISYLPHRIPDYF